MLPQNISSWEKSFGTHSQSQSSLHYIPSGAWEMQSQTALVASKSLTLSPICIMTISVINSMTGCRLYDLSRPLLMRMSELKWVCIEEQVPSHEVKVTQRMNEHVPGVICHSVSPTGIGWFVNSIKCLIVKDYRLPDKGGHDMSVVSHLHMKCCKSDAGDIRTLFMSPTNRSGELLSENPIRMRGIYQISMLHIVGLEA